MQVIRLGIFGDFDLFEFEGLDTTYELREGANDTSDAVQAWEPVDPDPGPDYVSWHFLAGMVFGDGHTHILSHKDTYSCYFCGSFCCFHSPFASLEDVKNFLKRCLVDACNVSDFTVAFDGACMPTLAKVFAHVLFYCTGVGVTILLMNLLVGVLGQNFELYQDRSVILFQRARAKMLVEMQARPWKYLLRRLFRLFGWMMLDQKELDSEEEEDSDSEKRVSFFRDLIFCFSFGPLLFLLLASSADKLRESIGTTLRRLTRCGIMVLLLFSPVFFSVSTCLAVILLFLRVVFQIQLGGIFYGLAVALGYLGEDGTGRAEECHIWMVLRQDASMDETRSLRSAMKAELETLTKPEGCSSYR